MLLALVSTVLLTVLPKPCQEAGLNSNGGYIASDKVKGNPEFDDRVGWVLALYRSSHESTLSLEGNDASTDVDRARVLRRDECRNEIWSAYYSEAGVRFLSETLRVQKEQLNMLAFLEVLSASRQPSAIPVLEEFSTNQNKGVARAAKAYLKQAQKNSAPK